MLVLENFQSLVNFGSENETIFYSR
jgi:hypothetical protein